MSDNNNYNNDGKLVTANILIAGISGVGKSTLINAVFGEKKAKTGCGSSQTKEMKWYGIDDAPIKICDTVGFEVGDNEGISKTKEAIFNIKKAIEERAVNDVENNVHAIWYCINEGGNRYQRTEVEFVKELHSTGLPFIIVITKCISAGADAFVEEINKMNREVGIHDIPVVKVLAEPIEVIGGIVVPAYGLKELVDKTVESMPVYLERSIKAGQKVSAVLKREECENIIAKYERLAEKGFWDQVPFANMLAGDKRLKDMTREICAMYNRILTDAELNAILFNASNVWTKNLFSWCISPDIFTKNSDKVRELMENIKKNGAEGFNLYERDYGSSKKVARMITYFGYSFVLAVEDVWKELIDQKVDFIKNNFIPILMDRLRKYLTGQNIQQ